MPETSSNIYSSEMFDFRLRWESQVFRITF
jgi:hypothetical protein